MTAEAKFSAAERNIIDQADASLRKLLPPPSDAGAGFPYKHHHRIARDELREALGRRAPSRHRQIAGLLLEWARASGDIRLYVYRPYAVWVAHHGPARSGPEWGEIEEALASAGSFEEFVSRQPSET